MPRERFVPLAVLFLLSFAASAPGADLLCMSTEFVGGYNHAINITFDIDDRGTCKAFGRHGFWTYTREVSFSCARPTLLEGKADSALSAWTFTTPAIDRDDLASLSFIYYPADRRALGFARLSSGVVFGVSCRK